MNSVAYGLVLSSRERRALELLASEDGERSLAVVVRRLIRREAHTRGLWPPRPADAEFAEAQQAGLEAGSSAREKGVHDG